MNFDDPVTTCSSVSECRKLRPSFFDLERLSSMFDAGTLSSIVFGSSLLISFLLAVWFGNKWEKNNPSKMGFSWGYFIIFQGFCNTFIPLCAYLFITFFVLDFDIERTFRKMGAPVKVGIALTILSCVILNQALKRKKWALILSTISTLNPLAYGINIFYFRNRWSEFSSERNKDNSFIKELRSEKSKTIRLVLFGCLIWIVVVPIYTFLFDPYGRYMNNGDYNHMIIVMFLPTFAIGGLYWVYERFIR